MNPQIGDTGTLNGPNGTKTAAVVTGTNKDGTLELSLLRPGFETVTPLSSVAVGPAEGQFSPRA